MTRERAARDVSGTAPPGGRAPERTCIGCGTRAPAGRLVRLAAVEGRVAVDRERRGGRGAWLHPSEECLDRAAKRRAFGRAFRREVVADAVLLRVQLTGNARKD